MDDDDFAQELVEACARGNLAMAKKLCKAGANVTRGDYDQVRAEPPLAPSHTNRKSHTTH
jgi:hypothetical protein